MEYYIIWIGWCISVAVDSINHSYLPNLNQQLLNERVWPKLCIWLLCNTNIDTMKLMNGLGTLRRYPLTQLLHPVTFMKCRFHFIRGKGQGFWLSRSYSFCTYSCSTLHYKQTNRSTRKPCSTPFLKNTLMKRTLVLLLGLHHHFQDNHLLKLNCSPMWNPLKLSLISGMHLKTVPL